MIYISVDRSGITTSGLGNDLMVNTDFCDVWWSGKVATFTNPKHGALLAIMDGELNEGLYWLDLWMIWYGRIDKEVSGVGINNGEGWGEFLAGDLFEEAGFKMEDSAWIKLFCGNIEGLC